MKKINFTKKRVMILILFMISSYFSYSSTFTWTGAVDNFWSGGSGNWDVTGDVDADGLPDSDDDVIIPDGKTSQCDESSQTVNSVTINATSFSTTKFLINGGSLTVAGIITLNGDGDGDAQFIVNSGSCTVNEINLVGSADKIDVKTDQSLTVTTDIANGGTFVINGTLTVGGTFSPTGLVNGTTSVIHFNGTTAQSIPEISFVNLTLSGSGIKTFTASPVVSGTFTGNTATPVIYNTSVTTTVLVGSYNTLTFSGGGTKEIGGTLTLGGALTPGTGTVRYMGDSEQDVISASYTGLEFSGGKKNITGAINNTGTFTPGATMVEYSGSGQVILSGNYQDLILSGTGAKTLNIGSTIGISSTFTSTATNVTNAATFNYNGTSSQDVSSFDYYYLTISGDKGAGTVTFGTDVGVSQTMSLTASNLTYDLTGSTINYNGTDAQSIPNFTGGYYNLSADNGIKQLTEAITVNNSFTITDDAEVETKGFNLIVNVDFTNNGVFTPSSGDLVRFSGSSASVISGSSTTAFQNLDITKTSTITINSPITIDAEGALTFDDAATSAVTISSGSLELLSTSSINTGRIGTIPSACSIVGNVTVQRYIPISTNVFSWWHLSNPTQGVTVADWQTYFDISGDFTGGQTISGSISGSEENWSLKTYDESQITTTFLSGWKNFPTSTNTETFVDGQGYRAYIVDSRTTSSVKTLSVQGTLTQQDFTFPMTYTNSGVTDAEGFAFLGNPYPSAIDFDDDANWTKTNVANEMYVWNAEQRQWRGWANGSAYNGGTSVIPIGQGFWVQATSASPVLKVTEDAKVSNLSGLKRIAQVENNIEISLTAQGSEDVITTDIRFSDIATSNYDVNCDASYLSRNMFSEFTSESLIDICSKTADGKSMFMNCLPISTMEIVPLVLTASSAKEYTLTLMKENYSLDSDVLLVDLFLNKEVKIEEVTSYTFTQTSDVKSAIQNRFEVRINNDRVVSTNDNKDSHADYIVSPNPFNGNTIIVKGIKSYEDVNIIVTDILGNNVHEEFILNNNSSFEKEINFVKKLESGIYFINFITNNKMTTQKVVVQ